ncbi:MAG: class I SAM-dependent methyltransferase [Actinomycetia bacterium]|nr:class I SAM-dependent methyltransferase [Actinomycetes bacterium]MCP4226972.1 class I SAM-dependent methyltransferase [Actinomycetes bacterium]MCP5031080.1 class I SAM-dependent methyltransferase [Actinomycetes bacterium]
MTSLITQPGTGPSPGTDANAPGLAGLGRVLTIVEALRAADDLDLLDQLREPTDIDDLTGVDGRGAELVLTVLGHYGVVRCVDHRWQRSIEPELLRWWLKAQEPIHDLLRTGEPAGNVADPAQAASIYPDVVDLLGRMTEPHVAHLITQLRIPGPAVLELASGSAPWSRALGERDPHLRFTLVDLPGVAERSAAAMSATGLDARSTVVADDLFTVELEDRFDLVIVAGMCRLVGAEANARLFGRIGQWCRPGGTVAVFDALDTRQAREAGLAVYRLSLATRTRDGRPWTPAHYADWLAASGFADISITATSQPDMSLLQATRIKE